MSEIDKDEFTREPSAEEIERVRRWDRRRQLEQQSESQARREKIETETIAKLFGQIGHREIVSIDGEQDYANWRKLVLRLDNNTEVHIGIEVWADPPELEITIKEVERGTE